MAGSGDEMAAGAAGRGRMRASHADREQVVEVLKNAFVHGRLTKDELDTRAGQALTVRTCAELAALIADIPPALSAPSAPAAVGPARPPAPARRRPLARAVAGSGGCLVITAVAVWVVGLADPGATPGPIPKFWAGPCFVVALVAVMAALLILVFGVEASLAQRRSRRQLPPRPGPGGHVLDGGLRGSAGHGPVPHGPRTDQTRADLRAHIPRPGRSYSPGRGSRAPCGIRPIPDAV